MNIISLKILRIFLTVGLKNVVQKILSGKELSIEADRVARGWFALFQFHSAKVVRYVDFKNKDCIYNNFEL